MEVSQSRTAEEIDVKHYADESSAQEIKLHKADVLVFLSSNNLILNLEKKRTIDKKREEQEKLRKEK